MKEQKAREYMNAKEAEVEVKQEIMDAKEAEFKQGIMDVEDAGQRASWPFWVAKAKLINAMALGWFLSIAALYLCAGQNSVMGMLLAASAMGIAYISEAGMFDSRPAVKQAMFYGAIVNVLTAWALWAVHATRGV